MKRTTNPFKPGDLIKYRDPLPTDFNSGSPKAVKTYGDIGIVYQSPVRWDWREESNGVLYMNSVGDVVLAHQKDLIKVS